MAVLGAIAQLGVFPLPLGKGRTAPASNEDIARVVVGTLVNPAPYIGENYRPTGPKLLDLKWNSDMKLAEHSCMLPLSHRR